MTTSPPPADVCGNDWKSLAVTPRAIFEPEQAVSIVITYFEAPEALELTLAALEGQSYPRELFEVVIVDDGSRSPLQPPEDCPLKVQVVHQEDLGFGLARARNTGARAAAHRILVFLDCDMMPEADWLAEHARWHHAAGDVLTLGFRSHVDTAGIDAAAVRHRPGSLKQMFADRPSQRPDWIEFHMSRTSELTSDDDDIFRIVTGGNLGVSRDFYETVGGYDESFTQWGTEDTEFGYRAYTLGGLLVPVREAMCWHQGEGAAPSEAESASLELQRAKISQLIAHHGFRRASPGRSFTVPQYVVTVAAGRAEADELLATVEGVLASRVHDLVVWIEDPADALAREAPDFERFRRLLAGDPRVRFGAAGGALQAFSSANFHVTVPAGAVVRADTLSRLRSGLGTAERTSVEVAGGTVVTLARARALHRAARLGSRREPQPAGITDDDAAAPENLDNTPAPQRHAQPTTACKGTAPTEPRRQAKAPKHWGGVAPSRFRRLRKLGRIFGYMLSESLRVRSFADARRLLAWFRSWAVRATAWRLRWLAWQVRKAALWIRWKAPRTAWQVRKAFFWIRWKAPRTAWQVRKAFFWIRWKAPRTAWQVRKAFFWIRWKAPRTIWRTRQAANWAKWRTRRGVRIPRLAVTAATYRLGPAIAACGERSQAVFAASDRVGSEPDPTLEVLLVDMPGLPEGWTDSRRLRTVALSEIAPLASTPAFDAEQVNPRNWTLGHKPQAAALGTVEHLPTPTAVRKSVKPQKLAAARRFSHLEDIAAYHCDAATRAGTLAALAAAGAVVHVADNDPELPGLLGPELYSLMADEAAAAVEGHGREALSVAMRREALRTHSLRARARQVLSAADFEGPPLPVVSILLASRRPDRLDTAIAAVAAQRYPKLELVLALHGEGFDLDRVERHLVGFDHPAHMVRVPRAETLGAALNAAVQNSNGTLLTKFDDDDFYGPEHVWDLVLAHEYSGACLVGKAAEYVYLQGADTTLHRFRGGGERGGTQLSLAGGAMIISRHDIEAVLGWRRVPSGVDKALIEDVVAAGRKLYRTHGRGYMLVRHAEGHTWQADDQYFLEQAEEVRAGCDLAFAGIP